MNAFLLLTVIKDDEILIDKKRFKLNGETKIGRSPESKIIVDLPMVSRCHCTIARMTRKHTETLSYSIIDGCMHSGKPKKSSNGILVNGKHIDAKELESGDRITLAHLESDGKKTLVELIFMIEEKKDNDGTVF